MSAQNDQNPSVYVGTETKQDNICISLLGEQTENIQVDSAKCPVLSQLGKELFPHELGGLIRDIILIHHEQNVNITFKYQNRTDRLLMPIPSVTSYCGFQKNNQQRNWIEPMLKHIAASNDTSEGARYLARLIFNN